jgi:hypothetical protein
MAQPTVRVRIGFTQNTFTLDDLVRGVLDSAELGGATPLTDVTSDVQNVTISRGRSRDLDTYKDLFVGFVTDINLTYPDKNNSFADFIGADAFMKLSNTSLINASFSSTDSGTLVGNVLDNANIKFGADRNIETGISTMQSISALSDNTLSVLQNIERSENGLLFMSKDGKITFKSRHTTFPSTPAATFSDDGSDVPYLRVDFINDDNEIFNVVSLQRTGGSTQTVQDVASQGKYLIRTLNRTGLLNNSDSEVLNAANFLLGKFKDALIRFDNLTVDLTEATTSNQNTVLDREVGDVVKVELTPPGSGSPAQITSNEIIDSINYNITPNLFTCAYKLSNADVQAFMRLDNALFGLLDTDKLGY